MENIITKHVYRADLLGGPALVRIDTPLMHQDGCADAFTITLRSGSTPAEVTGAQVFGYLLIKSTGVTIPLTGEAEGSTVTLLLTDVCYTQPGPFTLSVQVSQSGVRRTVWQGEGTILRTATDTVADPEDVIPSLSELLEQVTAMEQAADRVEGIIAEAVDTLDHQQEQIDEAVARTEEAIRSLSAVTAPAIVASAGGGAVLVRDAAARGALSAVSAVTHRQAGSGNPSPDNIRTITVQDTAQLVQAGRNLLVLKDESFTRGAVAVTVDKRGVLTFSGSSTLTSTATVNLAPVTLPAGTYTLSGTVTGGTLTSNSENATIAFVKAGETFHLVRKNALSVTFTLGSRQEIFIGCMVAADGAVYEDYAVQLQLECGSEATPWQPSMAVAVTAVLPEPIPGGAIDWLTGEITVDRMLITFDGTENWGKNNTVDNTVRLKTPDGAASVALCSHYICRSVTPAGNDMSTIIGTQLNVRDSVNAVDVATWKAYLAAQAAAGTPVTLLCARSTPVTLSIDPLSLSLLRGENALWCDCGDTSLSYVADTRLYIDQRLAAIAAASV